MRCAAGPSISGYDHTLMSGLDVTPTIALGNLDIVTAAAGLAELAVVPKCER